MESPLTNGHFRIARHPLAMIFESVFPSCKVTALADLLAPGSTIHAVDLDRRALERIPERDDGVEVRKIVGDIARPSLRLPSVDEIVMANTLHFHSGAAEQQASLRKLLSVTDRLLVVEYE
jgi:hypothetical protein